MMLRGNSVNISEKILALLVLLVIVLSATAATADYHPRGYDKECTLCQINQIPLAETAVTPFIPDNKVVSWRIPCIHIVPLQSAYRISLPGRSPPSC